MGRFKTTWLWSIAAVALLAVIPHASCGPPPKNALKLVKPTAKSSQDNIVSRRHHHEGSVEDEENYSGNRPNFGPFPQGFSQGPSPYRFADEPSDRYDVEEAPADNDNRGMGFMPEFGPPKGFPDLSKLTGGEFGKMEAPTSNNDGSFGNTPQYSTYPGGERQKPHRPFPSYAPQGGPSYDDTEDSPAHGGDLPFGLYGSPSPSPPQSAPRRKPHRGSRPPFGGGRPAFGGPGGPGGPGPYGGADGGPGSFGAPEGLIGGGPGSYLAGGPGLGGPSRPFGSSGKPSRPSPFGSSPEGPSYRPGPFGGGPDGPLSRPGPFGSDGPSSRGPFGGGSDGPSSRPGPPGGIFGSSDGPSSRPGPPGGIFGSSDGPSSRPGPPGGIFGSSDGPSSRPGPPEGLFGGSDGPSRPPHFSPSGDGPGSRPGPGYFGGLDGPASSNSPYDGPDGPPSRPSSFGSFDGPPSRPGSFSGLDGPSRPTPFGTPPRNGPFGSQGGPSSAGPEGPGPYGRPDSPSSAFSFQNSAPNSGIRLSRGYPRHHPNQVQNDDYKDGPDGDFSPFNSGPPQFSYPPRQHAEYSRNEEYPRGLGPYPTEGPRSRRPEYLPHQSPAGPYGSTHRHDNPKRPFVLKVSGLKSKYMRELPPGPPIYFAPSPDMKTKDTSRKFQESEGEEPKHPAEESPRAKSYLVKDRPKRDVSGSKSNSTSTTTVRPSIRPCKSRRCTASGATANKNNERRRTKNNPPKIMRVFRNSNNTKNSTSEDPMEADGTQQTAYWDVAPSYGIYNAYKKQNVRTAAAQPTAHERHDEYEEEEGSVAPAVATRATRRNQTYLDTTSDEQRFFPSFPAPPSPYLNPFSSSGSFGRPPLFPGPTANRAPSRFHPQFGAKYTSPPPNRGPSSAYPAESHERYLHTNLLGSGNFEVVRGGTYYGDDDDGYHHSGGAGHYHQEDDDGYFHHNGHSSPHGYRNNPSAGAGDFFANFRDFADINPPTRSFSHHHETVADAEPHGSASHEQPKNILDKLESSSDKIEVHQPYTSASSSSRDNDPMMATF